MRRQRIGKCSEAGMTFIEILVVVVIFAVVISAYLSFFNKALFFSRKTDERRLAIQKSIMMMEEVRAFVESGAENQIDLLDDFDDADRFNPMLTLEKNVKAPDDPLSGNIKLNDGWKYYRKVKVEKLIEEGAKDLRQVSITLYQSVDGQPGGNAKADVAGVFRTLASPAPPTQVMDTYIIAIENIPGWWVNMTTLRPLVEHAFNDLEASNPGLKFRNHWITRLSYGRDAFYRPQINANDLATKSIDQVYFYPGRINRQGFWYYSPDLMHGQIQVDNMIQNFEARAEDDELQSYTLADQFNSAMRAPDEERLFKKRQQAGFDPEPSLRLLLDDMIAYPERYRNALVVNLHGELLPVPPLRNYSDAARRPRKHPGVRVVTHPERLRVEAYRPVKFRVYPYVTDPNKFGANAKLSEGVSIFIRDVKDIGPIKVEMIVGGAEPYRLVELNSEKIGQRLPDGVLFNLEDVPLRHPARGGEGLSANHRLYGMEYIPSPVESRHDFSQNLLSKGEEPKNTARYIITIPSAALPAKNVLTVETRIGTDNTRTGTYGNEPENLSRTYVWLNQDPPASESYQFLGDPRHMPYADLKEKQAYNWYFKKIRDASGFFGFDATEDGWTEEAVDVDVPRFYQLMRKALLRTHAVFTTMTGFSFYYIGIGGEIGSDRPNGFPDGLPVSGKAYGMSDVKMVRAMTDGVENVRSASGDWYSIPWLGELYPDVMIPTWQRTGNLPAGRGDGQFYRAPWSQMPGSGKTFDRRRRTNVWGSASFFNAVGEKNGPFNHIFSSENMAVATQDGQELESVFNFPIEEKIKAIRPFTLDSGMNYPTEWQNSQYVAGRNQSTILQTFYRATAPQQAKSSALMHLISPDATESAFFVINGLSPAGETGTTYIGRYALLTLLQGFFRAGAQSVASQRIPQLPLIRIIAPKESADFVNADSAHLQWESQWLRWDNQPYVSTLRKEFSEDTELLYVVKYSPDEGVTWYYAQNDQDARLGQRPPDDLALSALEYDWSLSGKKGNYLVRVEAYRREISQHYSYHQIGLSVTR